MAETRILCPYGADGLHFAVFSLDHRRGDNAAVHRFFTPLHGFLCFDPLGKIGASTAVPDKLVILFENGFTAYRKPLNAPIQRVSKGFFFVKSLKTFATALGSALLPISVFFYGDDVKVSSVRRRE